MGRQNQNRIYAYLRVSTQNQELQNQKLEILEYAHKEKIQVDEFIEIKISSGKDLKSRLIEGLIEKLQTGDRLIVAELSRLGRSLGQCITMVEQIAQKGVRLDILRESLHLDPANGRMSIGARAQLGLFSLLAEIERELTRERVLSGLARAKAQGKKLGRPRGSTSKSKLDGKEAEISRMLGLGVSKASISKLVGCSWPCLQNFIQTRELE